MNHYHEFQLTDLVAQHDHARNMGDEREAVKIATRIKTRYGYRIQDGNPRLVK